MTRTPRPLLVAVALITAAVAVVSLSAASATDPAPTARPAAPVAFAPVGSLSEPSGEGSFRFGVATSATQIEDKNTSTDWWLWTQPAPEGLDRSAPVGDAVGGYTRALQDVDLVKNTGVDSYRFGIEWARIEPQRDVIDWDAVRHYDQQLDALVAQGIQPLVTINHFSVPTWVDDPRDAACANGPSDTNLCGLDHPTGGALVVDEMAEYAGFLAERYGDRVQDWVTINEPMVYMLFAHGFGAGPPGKASLNPERFDSAFVPAVRNLLNAHAAMYKAVKTVRPSASVGLANSVKEYVPVRGGAVSTDPADVAAVERFRWFFERTVVDSLQTGTFSAKLDGTPTEQHPEWRGTLDWLGLQLYDRTGVTAETGAAGTQAVPVVGVSTCAGPPCMESLDPSYWNPQMGYEQDPEALYPVVKRYSQEYPDLPIVVSESGIATDSAERRTAFVVRGLAQVDRLRDEGVDVRGYYYWSLLDNFEWLGGYGPHFGLYQVDRSTMQRTATSTVDVLADVASTRRVSPPLMREYGQVGPLPPEPTTP